DDVAGSASQVRYKPATIAPHIVPAVDDRAVGSDVSAPIEDGLESAFWISVTKAQARNAVVGVRIRNVFDSQLVLVQTEPDQDRGRFVPGDDRGNRSRRAVPIEPDGFAIEGRHLGAGGPGESMRLLLSAAGPQ